MLDCQKIKLIKLKKRDFWDLYSITYEGICAYPVPTGYAQYLAKIFLCTPRFRNEKMPLAFGYARMSSREQVTNSHALEQQIARLKAAGATKIFQDIQSGSRDDRPALKELMELVHNRKIDEVIITRIDRLARSLTKLRECIDVFQEAGVNLRILDQQIDLSTSQGKLMANVLGSLAEWETDLLSERIRHGKQHRRNKKKACESSPWGYQVIRDRYELDHRPLLCLLENRPVNPHSAPKTVTGMVRADGSG